MGYMLLIVEPMGQRRERGEAAGREVYERMLEFSARLQARGVLLAGESLASSAEAVRVRTQGGKPQLVDGPYAEAKEMIGGFFLLDVATRDEAVAIAAECPAAEWCSVEVRSTGPCYA